MKTLPLKILNNKTHFAEGVQSKSNLSSKEKAKLAEASKGFESLLTGMMLKSMTKTNGGLFGKDNYGGNVLDVLFETEISKMISEKQGLGIADKIYKNVTGESLEKTRTISREKNINNISVNNSTKIGDKTTLGSTDIKVDKYENYIKSAARKYGVNEKIIKSIIMTESAGNVNAKSSANAKGLMQLLDSTAAEMGVKNPWDANENIHGGTKYFAKLLKQFDGNKDLALAAYNAGPGNVNKYKGIPPFKETQNYVKRVNNYLNILEK